MDKTAQVVVLYVLTHMALIFFMYPGNVIESVSVGHWLAIACGYVLHVSVIAVYTKGLGFFDGWDLLDIFLHAGKIVATFAIAPVFVYLFMVNIITVRAYSEVVTIVFLAHSPLWAIMTLLLGVSSFIAYLGIETVLRMGLLLAILFVPMVAFVLSIVFQNADWHYILPLLDRQAASFSFFLGRPYLQSLFAFAGSFLFLGFLSPQVTFVRRKLLLASLILLPLFVVSVYAPLLTFGQNTSSRFQFPFILTVDTIEVSWLMFDRITMIFLISLIAFIMLFIAVVLWVSTRIVRRVLPFAKPGYVIVALAVSNFFVCMRIPDWSVVEDLFWWNTYFRIYVISVIPLLTLALGIRHRRRAVSA